MYRLSQSCVLKLSEVRITSQGLPSGKRKTKRRGTPTHWCTRLPNLCGKGCADKTQFRRSRGKDEDLGEEKKCTRGLERGRLKGSVKGKGEYYRVVNISRGSGGNYHKVTVSNSPSWRCVKRRIGLQAEEHLIVREIASEKEMKKVNLCMKANCWY